MAEGKQERDFTDLRVKHLELIQSVIGRMSANTSTVKRYALVVTAAAISLSKAASMPVVLLFTSAIVVVFGLLDARYLRLEWCFRDLYDEVRREQPDERPDFRLKPPDPGHGIFKVAKSWSVAGLYLAMVAFMLALIPFIGG